MIKLKNKFNFIIFLLCILATFLLTSIFISLFHTRNNVFNDKICLSPYTGNRLKTTAQNNCMIATYFNETDEPTIKGLSDANIIFEYIAQNGRTIYKAIFYDKFPDKIYPIVDVKNSSKKFLPEINFTDLIPNTIIDSQETNSLFITFNENTSSNFIYTDGLYYHFKNEVKDIDINNNSPIAVSNVVVLLTDKNFNVQNFIYSNPCSVESNGNGLLFSNGKNLKLTWSLNSNGILKVLYNDKPLPLVRGNTWWIFINKNCSIAYS